jgi:hypothetical protein
MQQAFYQWCHLFQSVHFRKVFQDAQRRFCADSNSKKSNPKFLSGRPSHAFGCLSMFRRFEQFKVASVRTSWQHVRMHIRVRDVRATPSGRGPYYENYMEQSCNRPDARATSPDVTLIWRAWSVLWKGGCTVVRPKGLSLLPDAA